MLSLREFGLKLSTFCFKTLLHCPSQTSLLPGLVGKCLSFLKQRWEYMMFTFIKNNHWDDLRLLYCRGQALKSTKLWCFLSAKRARVPVMTLCPWMGHQALGPPCTGIGSARTKNQNTYCGRVDFIHCISDSHSKQPCVQVSSGFRATVIKVPLWGILGFITTKNRLHSSGTSPVIWLVDLQVVDWTVALAPISASAIPCLVLVVRLQVSPSSPRGSVVPL